MDYLLFLQNLRESCPSIINSIFIGISEFIANAGFIIPLFIYWCVDKVYGAEIYIAYISANFVNQTIKNTCCIYRPWIKDARLYVEPKAASSATGYSFPSGHTTGATAIYGGTGKMCWSKKRKALSVILFLLILITAFSRNWLGAHTLADVLVAIAHTSLIIFITSLLRKWLAKKPERDTAITFAMIAVSFAITIFLCLKKYPLDYNPDGSILVDPFEMITDCYTALGVSIGGFLGWWIERHYINFSVEGAWWKRILRFVIGAAVAVLIVAFGNKIFGFLGAHWCHFIKYFLLLLFGTAGYPALFKKIKL